MCLRSSAINEAAFTSHRRRDVVICAFIMRTCQAFEISHVFPSLATLVVFTRSDAFARGAKQQWPLRTVEQHFEDTGFPHVLSGLGLRMESWRRLCDKLLSTDLLHLSLSWTNAWVSEKDFAVHSSVSSAKLFRCFPVRLFHSTVPWRMVFARPVYRVPWPHHPSFLFFAVVRRSREPTFVRLVLRTSLFVTWSR